jgi:hypothetical protein
VLYGYHNAVNDGAGIKSFVDIEESAGELIDNPGKFLSKVLPKVIEKLENGKPRKAAKRLAKYFLDEDNNSNHGSVGDEYEEFLDVGVTKLGTFDLKKGEAIMIEATVTSGIYPIGFKDECNVFGPLLNAIDKGLSEVLKVGNEGGLIPDAETTDAELFAGLYLMPVLTRTCKASEKDCTAGETFTAQPSPFVPLHTEFELHGDDYVLSGDEANTASPCDPNNLLCEANNLKKKRNQLLVGEALQSEDKQMRQFKLFDGTPSKSGSTQTNTAKFYFPSTDLGKGHYDLDMYVVAAAHVDIEHCQGIFGVSGSAKGMAGAKLGPHLFEVRKVKAAESECGFEDSDIANLPEFDSDIDGYKVPFLTWIPEPK